ncbi:MAG: hypothetical protein ACK40M_08495 [Flavobacteriales bacterium]
MNRLSAFFGLFLLFSPFSGQSQNTEIVRKGRFFFGWGYNRAQYSSSDIHLWGPGYDFVLDNVLASDRPEAFNLRVYANPVHLARPQYNFKIGYYLTDKISISLLDDHMKYVMRNWQPVLMDGYITEVASSQFTGQYNDSVMMLSPDFLYFEHTNGLNLLGAEIDFMDSLWSSRKYKLKLSMEAGAGIGILYPRSDISVFGNPGANLFHTAGYGLSAHIGLRLDMGKHFFLRATVKPGWINLPNILTYSDRAHGASQKFFFLEEYVQLCYILPSLKRKK